MEGSKIPPFYIMKRLLKFDEFVNENINEAKPSADFGFGAKNLSDLKPGDFVWREMERHNPQLGIYHTLNKAKVAKVSGKKIWLDEYGTPNPNFYDRETGEQLKTSGAAYGSSYYTLMTHQQALEAVNGDKEGVYKKDANTVKSFTKESAAQHVNESVNEGAVKAFEMGMKNLINNIRAGYGWIDPEFVYDSVINSSDFEDMDWETIKDEVYQRLIDQNLLYYANDADPETKGKRVSKVGEIKESVNEGTFYRLPRKTIENDLWSVAKNVQNFFSRASAGVDCKPEDLDSIIKNLEKIKKQVKKFSGREEVSGTVYESDFFEINEGDVNYTSDKYALVFVGGSIGSFNQVPVFVKGRIGSVIETSNDLEDLKATAARRRKQLSPGERKYYGMSYTVIELTPNKIKQIDNLIAQQSSNNDKIVDESEINEAIDEFVPASLTNEYQDLKKGDIVKIKAIEYTKLGDRSMIECIRPDGKKMDIKKEFITVKI
jgi:hypothetical protein